MPNWCDTSYVIEGPKEDLEKIQNAIKNHKVRKNSADSWEGNILDELGIKFNESNAHMRGFIDWEGDLTVGDDYVTLNFYAQEAWNKTDFSRYLEDAFPEITIYWKAEEPGCGIYETNDDEGKYFPERYMIDYSIGANSDTEYFTTEKEVIKYLRKISKGKIRSINGASKFTKNNNGDEYIYINEFTVVYE